MHYVLGSDSVFRNRKAPGSWYASDLLVLLSVSPHFNKPGWRVFSCHENNKEGKEVEGQDRDHTVQLFSKRKRKESS